MLLLSKDPCPEWQDAFRASLVSLLRIAEKTGEMSRCVLCRRCLAGIQAENGIAVIQRGIPDLFVLQ